MAIDSSIQPAAKDAETIGSLVRSALGERVVEDVDVFLTRLDVLRGCLSESHLHHQACRAAVDAARSAGDLERYATSYYHGQPKKLAALAELIAQTTELSEKLHSATVTNEEALAVQTNISTKLTQLIFS